MMLNTRAAERKRNIFATIYPYGLNEKNIYINSSFLTFLLLRIKLFNPSFLISSFTFVFVFCFNFFFISALLFFLFCLSQVADPAWDTFLSLVFPLLLLELSEALYSTFAACLLFFFLFFVFTIYLYYLFIHHCYLLPAY